MYTSPVSMVLQGLTAAESVEAPALLQRVSGIKTRQWHGVRVGYRFFFLVYDNM
jgi:hypothetical protein